MDDIPRRGRDISAYQLFAEVKEALTFSLAPSYEKDGFRATGVEVAEPHQSGAVILVEVDDVAVDGRRIFRWDSEEGKRGFSRSLHDSLLEARVEFGRLPRSENRSRMDDIPPPGSEAWNELILAAVREELEHWTDDNYERDGYKITDLSVDDDPKWGLQVLVEIDYPAIDGRRVFEYPLARSDGTYTMGRGDLAQSLCINLVEARDHFAEMPRAPERDG